MLPVVFLHGYPLSSAIWRHQTNLNVTEIFAPDFPGFGGTSLVPLESMDAYADWAIREAEVKGHRRAVWVGHSMGGYIALAMARHHADRMAALVLVNTQARADTEEARRNRWDVAGRALREGVDFIAETMSPKLLNSGGDPSLVGDLGQMIRAASPDGIAQAQRAMADRRDQRDLLPALTIPVLICYGQNDQLFGPDRAIEMAAAIPGARLEAFAASGHMTMMEEPKRFNDVLLDFLTSHSLHD